MQAKRINPILNVSDIVESFAWFEKFGFTKGFNWGDPTTFGSVYSGDCEIFMCQAVRADAGRARIRQRLGLKATSPPTRVSGFRFGLMMSMPSTGIALPKGWK
jgi:hypothetical protein